MLQFVIAVAVDIILIFLAEFRFQVIAHGFSTPFVSDYKIERLNLQKEVGGKNKSPFRGFRSVRT